MKRIVLISTIILVSALQISAQAKYKADASSTVIGWTGKKIVGGSHNGTINLKEGWLAKDKNAITGGEFVVDMTTIKDLDLKDESYRSKLEGHLKSDDFFGVEKYPVSKLVLTGSTPFVNGTATVKGDLTIKAATNPVEFTATESVTGDKVTYKAVIIVDRSIYDVRYGSGKFFSNLGDNAISDEFTLDVTLVVSK